ncbi:Endochitinase 1 [Tulasnella sp. 403]|nr:Endochitinase 1 [Tulasnella sp. 403]
MTFDAPPQEQRSSAIEPAALTPRVQQHEGGDLSGGRRYLPNLAVVRKRAVVTFWVLFLFSIALGVAVSYGILGPIYLTKSFEKTLPPGYGSGVYLLGVVNTLDLDQRILGIQWLAYSCEETGPYSGCNALTDATNFFIDDNATASSSLDPSAAVTVYQANLTGYIVDTDCVGQTECWQQQLKRGIPYEQTLTTTHQFSIRPAAYNWRSNTQAYPFDTYVVFTTFLAIDPATNSSRKILGLSMTGTVPNFSVTMRSRPVTNPAYDRFEWRTVTVHIARAQIVIGYAFLIWAINWLMTGVVLWITISAVQGRRRISAEMFAIPISALFALPAVRQIMPTSPAFGCILDYSGIILNLAVLTICSVSLLLTVIARDTREYSPPATSHALDGERRRSFLGIFPLRRNADANRDSAGLGLSMTMTGEREKISVSTASLAGRAALLGHILTPIRHVLYGPANLNPDTGEVFLAEPEADYDKHYPGDPLLDSGTNLYGNFKQIYLLKKRNRHLKLVLCIGRYAWSPNFHTVVVDSNARKEFVRSSIKILEDYGLDGLNVDYRCPDNSEQARGYTETLRLLREGLDAHARRKGGDCWFELSAMASCRPPNYEKLDARGMDRHLDMWNLVAYGYGKESGKVADHFANVYKGRINTEIVVKWYMDQGIPRHKLIIGVPLHGRSFMSTKGLGHPFTGVGPGSFNRGLYDYRSLPLPNAVVYRNEEVMASWSYDAEKQEVISFDDALVAKWKAEWICKEEFGGAMYYDLSGDKTGSRENGREGLTRLGNPYVPGPSIVEVISETFGRLDGGRNWLEYGESMFDNMRSGMRTRMG